MTPKKIDTMYRKYAQTFQKQIIFCPMRFIQNCWRIFVIQCLGPFQGTHANEEKKLMP